MKKFQVSLIDADKTMFVQDPMWDQLDNKNVNALSQDFLLMLRHLAPTPWFAGSIDKWCGDVNIIVSGRLPEHEEVTMDRVREIFPADHYRRWSFVSVKWDDKFSTRKESYGDYVERKADKLIELYYTWSYALGISKISPNEIQIYEDDKNVLDGLGGPGRNLKLFLMNEDGTKAIPYGEK